MGTEQFTTPGVEHDLGEPGSRSHGDRLAIRAKREFAHLDRSPGGFRLSLGQAHAGHLGVTVGTGRNPLRIQLVRMQAGDFFDTKHTLMTGLVREPRSASDVTNSICARFSGTAIFVRQDVRLLHPDCGIFEAQVFDIANNAGRDKNHIDLHGHGFLSLATSFEKHFPLVAAAH